MNITKPVIVFSVREKGNLGKIDGKIICRDDKNYAEAYKRMFL